MFRYFWQKVNKKEIYVLIYGLLWMYPTENLLGLQHFVVDRFAIVQHGVVNVVDLVSALGFNMTTEHCSSVRKHR